MINGGLPSVSPDGKRIAFVSNRSGSSDVYVASSDGGSVAQVSHKTSFVSAPTWTADGRVAYSTFASGASTLYTSGPAGSDEKVVTSVPARSPLLSADGRSVLYSSGNFPHLTLVAGSVAGGATRPLSDSSAMIFNAVWSPDGKRIAYARADSMRDMQVWVMNADGTGARQLTKFPGSEGHPQWPAWSPDGRSLAVQAGVYNTPDHAKDVAHIWTVDVASGKATKLNAHEEPYLDETPSWFPDGKRIAFQSNRSGRMEIWVMNVDGSGATQITR